MMDIKKTFLYIFVAYFTKFEEVRGEEDSPSVIIIGAGAAGIAAASKLFENGFKKITVLEAENRIGGRIHTTKFNKYLVDLGAQYVFTDASVTLPEIKWPLSLMANESRSIMQSIVYDSSGMRLDDAKTGIVKAAYEYAAVATLLLTDEKESFGLSKKRKLEIFFNECSRLKEKRGIIEMILMSNSAVLGHGIDQMSARHINESKGMYDNMYNWKNRGYSTILDVMVKRYPNPREELPIIDNTILNAEVSLIENNLKDGNVIIKTTNGNVYCADHVIVTIPLGVLKAKYNTLFNPPLPEIKIKTIQELGYGYAETIFLFFPKPFWNYTNIGKSDYGYTIFWKDSDRKALRKNREKSWLLGVHELTFVTDRPKLLMTRVTEEHSLDMDNLSDQQVLKHISEVIQKFFGRDYNIVKPTEIIRSKWNTNQNFRGSCTYYKFQGPTDDDVFIKDLAEPIGEPKPKILFAGEATYPDLFGTVRGAIYSGYREAKRLTELYAHTMQTKEVKAPSTSQQTDCCTI